MRRVRAAGSPLPAPKGEGLGVRGWRRGIPGLMRAQHTMRVRHRPTLSPASLIGHTDPTELNDSRRRGDLMLTTLVGMPVSELDTPALLVDIDAMDRNIASIAGAMRGRGEFAEAWARRCGRRIGTLSGRGLKWGSPKRRKYDRSVVRAKVSNFGYVRTYAGRRGRMPRVSFGDTRRRHRPPAPRRSGSKTSVRWTATTRRPACEAATPRRTPRRPTTRRTGTRPRRGSGPPPRERARTAA